MGLLIKSFDPSLLRSLSRSLISRLISVNLVSPHLHFQENTAVIKELALSSQEINCSLPTKSADVFICISFYHWTNEED